MKSHSEAIPYPMLTGANLAARIGLWTPSTLLSPHVASDGDAVIESLVTDQPLDEETRNRIRERGRRLTEEIRQKFGEMNVAVDLVRESRDE